MKNLFLVVVLLISGQLSFSQEKVIPLYEGAAPGSGKWNWDETELKNEAANFRLVYNVSNPTLTVFKPDDANGTAVVICPGGAFQFLAINHEGYEVARKLNGKGITAFVLKYRLSHSLTDNPMQELNAKQPGSEKFNKEIEPVVAMAIMDGKNAISYIREHAEEYGISTDKIGIMGFSAGGTVTAGVAYTYDKDSRPDFVAPIYPYVGSFDIPVVPDDAPPMFICAATDDEFGFEDHCVKLYDTWNDADKPVEMHLYTRGGHGFGTMEKKLPVDTWLTRFTDWLEMLGYAE